MELELPEGWKFIWEDELDVDVSWCDDDDRADICDVLCVRLVDSNGRTKASLGNCAFGFNTEYNREYREMIEQELIDECVDEIEATGEA
jgi:hypothetical protein